MLLCVLTGYTLKWKTLTYSPIRAGKTNPAMEGKTFFADIQTLKMCATPWRKNCLTKENMRAEFINWMWWQCWTEVLHDWNFLGRVCACLCLSGASASIPRCFLTCARLMAGHTLRHFEPGRRGHGRREKRTGCCIAADYVKLRPVLNSSCSWLYAIFKNPLYFGACF